MAELRALASSATRDLPAAVRTRYGHRIATVCAVVAPALAGAASLLVSWQRWINPLIDSGREMDVPWRLSQGERLYGDVTYYYGPLGPWLNALALRLFGNRWAVLETVCLLLSAAIFLLLYKVLRQAGASRLAAVAGTSLGAALCMGAPNGGAFVFPYSSSSLLAVAGALLALWAAGLPARPRHEAVLALGMVVALASRVELGLLAAAALVACALRARPLVSHRRPRQATLAALARTLVEPPLRAVLLGGAAAAALYGVAFWRLPWRDLVHDGPLMHFLSLPAEWRHFYLHVAGLGSPLASAGQVLASLALDGALLVLLAWFDVPGAPPAPAAAASAGVPRPSAAAASAGDSDASPATAAAAGGHRRRWLYPVCMAALVAAYLTSPVADPYKNLPPFAIALPLLAAAAAALLWLRGPLTSRRERALFLLCAFSAGAASRVVLALSIGPRINTYATAPLPLLVACTAVLAFDHLARRLPHPAIFRRRLAVVLAIVAAVYLYRVHRFDHRLGVALVRTPAGALRLPPHEARSLRQVLGYLGERARPGDTLTGFPEGGFFNFVTGMRSPLRQDEVLPGVLSGDREAAAARLIATDGPRFILLCNRSTAEWGPASFGRDYDVALWHEVERHYRLGAAFGAAPTAPVGSDLFFVRVYERRPQPEVPRVRLAERGPGGARFAAAAQRQLAEEYVLPEGVRLGAAQRTQVRRRARLGGGDPAGVEVPDPGARRQAVEVGDDLQPAGHLRRGELPVG